MSTALRLLLYVGLVIAVALMAVQPTRLRWMSRRLRLVGFVYVATVLISAALRALGTVDWF
ncbi:MAG: hypothetical protein EXR66_03865 [Dehalococcoidia bacterium]|nr:hypothetical protein [Dehalococcoidia bacterium]